VFLWSFHFGSLEAPPLLLKTIFEDVSGVSSFMMFG